MQTLWERTVKANGYVTMQVPKRLRDRVRIVAARLSEKHSERVTMSDILSDAVHLLAAQHDLEFEGEGRHGWLACVLCGTVRGPNALKDGRCVGVEFCHVQAPEPEESTG